MSDLPAWMRKLNEALDALPEPADPMLLSQLDGYLAGILVCPELIMPGEWLPGVWTRSDDDEAPVFESERQFQTLVELIMKAYNGVSRDLGRDRYAPLYDVMRDTDEVFCGFWLMGFEQAMALRPDSWADIFESDDDDAATALSILTTLIQVDDAEALAEDDETAELFEQAPDMIPYCVQHLHAWRVRNDGPPPARTKAPGRNEPCPCGSGKKYKKCCGLN